MDRFTEGTYADRASFLDRDEDGFPLYILMPPEPVEYQSCGEYCSQLAPAAGPTVLVGPCCAEPLYERPTVNHEHALSLIGFHGRWFRPATALRLRGSKGRAEDLLDEYCAALPCRVEGEVPEGMAAQILNEL